MLNLVLFGPPGAGKGTQSESLVERYQLVHLSTGDLFRFNIKNQTELGILAKSFMDQGSLVPDSVTISMLKDAVNKNPQAKGFIFDGFPRTNAQAEALDTFLATQGTAITSMVALEVTENELKLRLAARAKTSGRIDDANPVVIQHRIDVYNRQRRYCTPGRQPLYVGMSFIKQSYIVQHSAGLIRPPLMKTRNNI